MAKDVKCEVNNCFYWRHGNLCGADEIYVVAQRGDRAYNSRDTDCKTFKPADM